MLSVAIHKDVAEYQPKVIGKLTARTATCIALALAMSVATGMYMNYVLNVDVADNYYVIFIVSIPFWLCGFMRPHGLKFEQFAMYWLEHEFKDNRIHYMPTMAKIGYTAPTEAEKKRKKEDMQHDKQYRKLVRTPGIEAYSPREGRVLP